MGEELQFSDDRHDMTPTTISCQAMAGTVARRAWLQATYVNHAVTFGFKANHQRPTEAST